MAIQIARAAGNFADWAGLLRLLKESFAFMEERIDPPSSVHELTPGSIAAKAQVEALFLAADGRELVGCVFARQQGDSLYVGKLAVRADWQGKGIGRRLMDAAEKHARDARLPYLELDTRIELVENHKAFAAMGFVRTAERAHAGYDRPTFIIMRKQLTHSKELS